MEALKKLLGAANTRLAGLRVRRVAFADQIDQTLGRRTEEPAGQRLIDCARSASLQLLPGFYEIDLSKRQAGAYEALQSAAIETTEFGLNCFGERMLLCKLNHRINNEFASTISMVALVIDRSGNEEVKAGLNRVTRTWGPYRNAYPGMTTFPPLPAIFKQSIAERPPRTPRQHVGSSSPLSMVYTPPMKTPTKIKESGVRLNPDADPGLLLL
jgi:hypothetical protein